ncbi:transcriptional regulator [Pseudomonas sp. BF-R-19]|uniref:transcriptional regulator n=1 Tax=Pseudomonas sp. BF-R-19 TaxID=2832397 RepID=UPI001CC1B107|nr:transcriptional regulator [Pseudomonas sp. BF-R-19]
MASTTLGVKLDSRTRDRLKKAANHLDRTPHWFMKIAIKDLIEKVESGVKIEEIIDEAQLPSDELKHSVTIRDRQ